MPDNRTASTARREYDRLISLLAEELWSEADRPYLEDQFGRPIVAADRQSFYSAACEIFDMSIVDAIAEALEAGVSQRDLVDTRGWLSHNDIRGYIARARKPHAYDYEPTWIQASVLKTVVTDVARIATEDREEAARLLRSAKTFLRRWVRQIPAEPTEAQLSKVATRWRSEHIALWCEARAKLIKQIDGLELSKKLT